ncbi:MAG: ispH [Rhodospirillaceae bacterium]|nr:MAG: ispH [Rhodospirillaceae bacterium]
MTKRPLAVLLAAPRGFCAGVDRAIQTVEEALRRFGAPVYVRHEIVHNRHVVQMLETKGAVFVEELDQVPDNLPVIFSAHGVPKQVTIEAEQRGLFYVDATCPLVSKVHNEAERHFRDGRHIILIGHAGHPEVVGTMGQVPTGWITLVENEKQAEQLTPDDPEHLAFVTQTTLSVDDSASIIAVLQRRFPGIRSPRKEDICYATTNRQQAVKAIIHQCDAMLVIGAPNSSNARRLVEVARNEQCARAMLIQSVEDVDWDLLTTLHTLGITASASTPEVLVDEVLAEARKRFNVIITEVCVATEDVTFKLPSTLVVDTFLCG